MSIQLRPYQRETVDVVFKEYEAGVNSQLIHLATGTGKTTIAGTTINELPMRLACAGRTLWLTHEESLIEQSAISVMCTLFPDHAEKIRDTFRDEEGVLAYMTRTQFVGVEHVHSDKASKQFEVEHIIRANLGIIKQNLFQWQPRLVVASVQTLINRLNKIPADWFDMIVVDECHYAMAKSWSTVINYFKPKIRLGLTATPTRLDGLSLEDLFAKTVVSYDLKWGIRNGWLCEMEAHVLKTNVDLTGVKKSGAEFNLSDLSDAIDTPVRNIKIVRKWQEIAQDRPTIAYCCTVEHAMNLCDQFNNLGVPASFVVGDEQLCPDRKKRLRDFRAGKYKVMMNVNILVAGYDYPDVGCVITASPTMSEARFIQQVGRGSRLKSQSFVEKFGKNNCLILDITDNSKKHNIVNTETLDEHTTIEERTFMGAEKRAELIAIRDARKLKHVQEKDESFSLLALPKSAVKMDAPWMKQAASPTQLKWLAKEGFDTVNNNYTRGHANQLISNLPCSQRDLKFLQENGYDVTHGATQLQYEMAKKEVLARNTTKYFNQQNANKNPFAGLN